MKGEGKIDIRKFVGELGHHGDDADGADTDATRTDSKQFGTDDGSEGVKSV